MRREMVGIVSSTADQYRQVVERCWKVFESKFVEYGPSWRVFRPETLCDRIYIKAARIRHLQAIGGVGKVDDSIESEYVGIVNYSVILLDRIANEGFAAPDLGAPVAARWLDLNAAQESYRRIIDAATDILEKKNHDYNEVWRQLLLTTFADEILSRVLRMREILQTQEVDRPAVEAQLVDVINYSAFALIRMGEGSV
ncbi:DUF1599 domain-containing protein [Actinokineospora soli]|uniref:DUF1599 domain-containing protein n=1 Tax=Actinokineospora soli TaxID=1048753 RepID=A0ABW2TXL7_9PSEU